MISRAHICHKYHKLFLWRKNCHVEKFWEILGNFEKFWENLGDFATIYVLSCGEKLSPKSTFVEKKWQIWGLVQSHKSPPTASSNRSRDNSMTPQCHDASHWPSSITARTVTKVLSASTPSPPPGLLSCAGPLLLVVSSGEATVSLLSFVRWQYFWFRASDARSGRASGWKGRVCCLVASGTTGPEIWYDK